MQSLEVYSSVADVMLPVGSSDSSTTRPRDTNHSRSSTTLLVSQPRRYNNKVYGYRINSREEVPRRRRRRESSRDEEQSYRRNRHEEEPRRRRRRESSSDEDDQYRGRIEGSRKRRHEEEIGERGSSRGERFGSDIKRREGSGEGSMKRRRSHEEEQKHERKTEENRERRSKEDKGEDQDGRNSDEKKVEEKSVQQLPNSPTVLNKKGLEEESGNKKKQEFSSPAQDKALKKHSDDTVKMKEIGDTKEANPKGRKGQENAEDTTKIKVDQQLTSTETAPTVSSEDLLGARALEKQVPSMNAGSKASKKQNEEARDEDKEAGEKPIPPKESSANSNQVLSETTTLAEQQVCSNTDPEKNMLETSNRSRGEKKEKEVKDQENKRADSKNPEPGITQSVAVRDEEQTGVDLGSISTEEPPASRSESQNETPETPSRRG